MSFASVLDVLLSFVSLADFLFSASLLALTKPNLTTHKTPRIAPVSLPLLSLLTLHTHLLSLPPHHRYTIMYLTPRTISPPSSIYSIIHHRHLSLSLFDALTRNDSIRLFKLRSMIFCFPRSLLLPLSFGFHSLVCVMILFHLLLPGEGEGKDDLESATRRPSAIVSFGSCFVFIVFFRRSSL